MDALERVRELREQVAATWVAEELDRIILAMVEAQRAAEIREQRLVQDVRDRDRWLAAYQEDLEAVAKKYAEHLAVLVADGLDNRETWITTNVVHDLDAAREQEPWRTTWTRPREQEPSR